MFQKYKTLVVEENSRKRVKELEAELAKLEGEEMNREEAIKLALEAGFTLDNAWFNIKAIENLIEICKGIDNV